MRKGTACESESIVTVHWFPANCNIRSPHLKFCFAKGGLLTPESLSYAAKHENNTNSCFLNKMDGVFLLFYLGICIYISESLCKGFHELFYNHSCCLMWTCTKSSTRINTKDRVSLHIVMLQQWKVHTMSLMIRHSRWMIFQIHT